MYDILGQTSFAGITAYGIGSRACSRRKVNRFDFDVYFRGKEGSRETAGTDE